MSQVSQSADTVDVRVCTTCGGYERVAEPCGCIWLLGEFCNLMLAELQANATKNGRSAWRGQDPNWLMFEVFDHTAKLHMAMRELDRRREGREPRPLPWGDRAPESLVREFAVDTANMAMMLLDSLRLMEPER